MQTDDSNNEARIALSLLNAGLGISTTEIRNMSKPPFTMSKYARREDLLADAATFYEADAAKGRALLAEWLCASSNFNIENWALRVRNFVEDEGEQDDA